MWWDGVPTKQLQKEEETRILEKSKNRIGKESAGKKILKRTKVFITLIK